MTVFPGERGSGQRALFAWAARRCVLFIETVGKGIYMSSPRQMWGCLAQWLPSGLGNMLSRYIYYS